MLVSLEHSRKASLPIEVTPFGMVTLVRPEQYLKTPLPIEVTLSGMLMLVSLGQSMKASLPIEVTPELITMPTILTKRDHIALEYPSAGAFVIIISYGVSAVFSG